MVIPVRLNDRSRSFVNKGIITYCNRKSNDCQQAGMGNVQQLFLFCLFQG